MQHSIEGNEQNVKKQDAEQVSFRLRERLSEPAMLDLTKRLIAISTENPPGNQYEECATTLIEELVRLRFDDVRREGACVLASVGTGPRTLYFSGHYDVVPAQSRDQFQPRVENQNLFGRGSSDMKSGLAAMIHAAVAVHDEGLLKSGRIGIVLVPDEETAATPLYKCLEAGGRLTRPRHWKEFVPFTMAHTPLKMSIEEAHDEVRYGWDHSYSPQALAHAVDSLADQPLGYRIDIFLARLCFRGIYFPMMNKLAWVKVIAQNWRTIIRLTKEAVFRRRPEVRGVMNVRISLEAPLGEEGASQLSDVIS